MPHRGSVLEIELDFLDDVLLARTSDGRTERLPLKDGTIAGFYQDYRAMLSSLDVDVHIHGAPNEVLDATPFADDHMHAAYDGDAARRCWQVLIQADRALKQFRGDFTGKCSPSHFWWGGFDLACTRFSGRRAPQHPGGIPNCPDYVTREAYSHECISAGWWPGMVGSPVPDAAFYAYAYPEPDGCSAAPIGPKAARYDAAMREWILPYEAVRTATDPDALIAEFLQTTYQTAATLGGWDVESFRSSYDTVRRERKAAAGGARTRADGQTNASDAV